NAFLSPLERIAPAVRETRARMAAMGHAAFLTGSGPTLYVPCHDENEANRCADSLRSALDATVIATRTGL
ncbi:MAG TPA: hypothetical protein VIG44_05465, partial [Thermomicrobiales bacterium]